MKAILCLDDDYGISFFGKRQSQDKNLRLNLKDFLKGNKIYMKPYSASLYQDTLENIIEVSDFNNLLDAYVLFEEDINPYIDKVDTLVLYFWNRTYPKDVYFNKEFLSFYKEVDQSEFVGTSHEKITRIVYRKEASYAQEKE